MNLLKSIFISNYMMVAMGIAGYAGWRIFHGADIIAWGGVLLATAPLMMLIGWLMMFKNAARTSKHFPVINLLGAMGTGMAAWAWHGQGVSVFVPIGPLAPILALIGWGGFLLYVYWYSNYGRKPSPRLKVGSSLPNFTVKHANGTLLQSSQLTDKPTILIFYRGNWCPLCVAQVKELVAKYKDLDALGARVALISPQPHANTVALAKKYGVEFEFLTDEGNAAARTLGIDQNHGLPMGMQMMGYDSETVMPTVIITDANGKIIWVHETDNYRVRPEPDVYLEVLRKRVVMADA
ncbi:alkyl hydroperoxide reductase/ thiol specific antioxidant/ Mal allergen [Methyloglobulus morosus KoM1]|uniref:thioredoxin-dependent peroxiredoxin n=1 Tax=Methyloglobulus morosus KoM1 TaxID=1116472 RepID=V5BNT7_9GAMM|nr:peroxiredoxin family protein [Methyloglobulus morosus]ESS67827.1 alkyl hydroperoxide reductase/ thiol specific antioxidant/ Mal allergen [Methyloglobulus morosus KoM1]